MGTIPEILYKYLPPERVGFEKGKGFFPNLEVSFAAPVEFNDPFDCAIHINITENDFVEHLNSAENFKKTKFDLQLLSNKKVKNSEVRKIIKGRIKEFRKMGTKDKEDFLFELGKEAWETSTKANVRILSLSKNYNNLLMWSHYAKNHTGFVVGIKSEYISKNFSYGDQGILGLREVIYENKFSELNPFEDPYSIYHALPFFKKSKCWEYEEEVRYVGYATEKCSNFHIEKIPNNYIESIRLGAKIEDEYKKKIVDFCREKLSNVSIYQAQLQKTSYALDFIKI